MVHAPLMLGEGGRVASDGSTPAHDTTDAVRLHQAVGSRLPADTRGANPRQHRRVHPLMAAEGPDRLTERVWHCLLASSGICLPAVFDGRQRGRRPTMKPIYALVTVASVLLLWVGSGCLDSTGTDRGAAGTAGADFLLNAEPEAAQSVVDVRTRCWRKRKSPRTSWLSVALTDSVSPRGIRSGRLSCWRTCPWHRRRRLRTRSTTRRPSTMPRTAHSAASSRRRNWPDWR